MTTIREPIGILSDADVPVLTYHEDREHPYAVTTPDGNIHTFEFEHQSLAFRMGYRSANKVESRSGDPVLDLKLDAYEKRRAELTMEILDDVIFRDAHVGHLTKVMTGKCPNCNTCYEGEFTKCYVESRYAVMEFEVDTESTQINDEQGEYGDHEYMIGYDCAKCGVRVDEDTLASILYLTDETLYSLIKKSTHDAMQADLEDARKMAKSHRTFLKSSGINREDVKPGMPCRFWTFTGPRPGEKFGVVVSTTIGHESDGRIKVVADDGSFAIMPMVNAEFGAFIERVGDYTIMQKTNGMWISFRDPDGSRGEPTGEPEFESRQQAIRAISFHL
jgi:hypothetical protein